MSLIKEQEDQLIQILKPGKVLLYSKPAIGFNGYFFWENDKDVPNGLCIGRTLDYPDDIEHSQDTINTTHLYLYPSRERFFQILTQELGMDKIEEFIRVNKQ